MLAGLLGSGHCFGMCGGIAAGLGPHPVNGPGREDIRRSALIEALVFNMSRIVSYMLLGAIAGAVLGAVTQLSDVGRWLRAITAVLILLIGLRFLFDWRGLDFLEKMGSRLWARIMPAAVRASARNDLLGQSALGLCWGLLPCGLVYTILITAAASGDVIQGALVMLAFGAGTLPSMLGMSLAAPMLSTMIRDRQVRRIIGFGLIVLAVYSFLIAFGVGGELNSASHHGLKA